MAQRHPDRRRGGRLGKAARYRNRREGHNAVAADLTLADRNDKALLVRIDLGIELVLGHDLHDPLPQLHPLDEARIVVGIAPVERLSQVDRR
jgi:hypothetical protein